MYSNWVLDNDGYHDADAEFYFQGLVLLNNKKYHVVSEKELRNDGDGGDDDNGLSLAMDGNDQCGNE